MKDLNLRIKNYVQLFFDNIPYSEKNLKMKDEIIKELKEQYQSSQDMDEIVLKYNSLEKLGKIAGYSIKDIKKMKSETNLVQPNILKRKFKKQRRKAYELSILIVSFLIYEYNFFLIQQFFYFLLALISIIAAIFVKLSIKKETELKETYSLEAYHSLKITHDKYTKRFFNTFFLLVTMFIFGIITYLNLRLNSKSQEILESLNSIIFYYEIVLILLLKNYYLANWSLNKLGKKRLKIFQKNFLNLSIFSLFFWSFCLIICCFIKNYFIHIFLIFTILYLILALIYNFFYRKNLTFYNIIVNKKRILIYSCIVLTFFTYSLMQKDFWLLQPYINSIPNLAEKHHKINYNEANGIYTITKENNQDFKILQLTDIHLGGSIFSFFKDQKALEAVYKLIKYSKPDLIIVTGDLTFPLGFLSFSINNHTPVMQFASFMRNIGIPWAFTYGNHDTEAIATYNAEDLNQLYESLSYKTSKNFLYPYTQPNISGRSNQLIEIRNSDHSLNQAIFLIDSNAYTGEGINKYDYIHDDQVEWYEKNIKKLEAEEKKSVSSLVFFHIPLQQYKTAYELYEQGSKEVRYYFGSNDEKMIDKVCASEYPSKMFDKAKELGSTKAFFCGHDHYNNMSLEYQGIRLTYGMSIDYLAMPGISNDSKQRGGTLITIKEDSTYHIEQLPLSNIS